MRDMLLSAARGTLQKEILACDWWESFEIAADLVFSCVMCDV